MTSKTNGLERLRQDEDGFLYREHGGLLRRERRMGRLRTIRAKNPVVDIGYVVNKMIENGELTVPEMSNAFLSSDFNPDTQFVRGGEIFSCYAIQFYRVKEGTQ
jgi:hypothetical protein